MRCGDDGQDSCRRRRALGEIIPPPRPFWPKDIFQGRGVGVWLRENGTICPFGFFPPVLQRFLANLGSISVIRPVVVLFGFPLVSRHFGCFWVLEPKTTFCPFRPPKRPFVHARIANRQAI